MSTVIKLKKGLDIRLDGSPAPEVCNLPVSGYYAVKPTDFAGLVPKMILREGDPVKAGTPLFCDKNNPEVLFCSPVSGTLENIVRGDKRKILEVIVKASENQESVQFSKPDISVQKREEIIELMLKSGVWPSLIQRPYGYIASPKIVPDAIFVSGFSSAPLAPDYNILLKGNEPEFKTGMQVLSALSGKLYLGLNVKQKGLPVFDGLIGTEVNFFEGPHPAGNVGVQIHHIRPVGKGNNVWTMSLQDVIILGRLFRSGVYNPLITISLSGSMVTTPKHFSLLKGMRADYFAKGLIKEGLARYISGNVLTGTKINSDGFLGFYDDMVTVIPEGKHHEFLGWIAPGFNKFSISRTFFSWLMPKKNYNLDSNINGGSRAFVFTGLYEKVLPMDIYPMQLLKSCLAKDIDKMEALGIYEVLEEDLALCEVICPSKTNVQEILREGLDYIAKEMNG